MSESCHFLEVKNLHRTGSKVGFRVSRNWVMVRGKKNLLSKWTPVLDPLCQTFRFWRRHGMTKTRYILWCEMNGLLNQLSFFGHILFLRVTIDALNSLKNFRRIGSQWVCRQPRKSWDFMICSDLDCQISRIWMINVCFFTGTLYLVY